MNGVEIGSSLTPLLDANEIRSLKFFEPGSNASLGAAQIIGQFPLPGEAFIQFASVFEQHGIDELGADRDLFAFQYKVGNAGPTALRGDISSLETEVAVFESGGVPQALHTKSADEVLTHPSVLAAPMSTAIH